MFPSLYNLLPGAGGSQIQYDGALALGDQSTNELLLLQNCFNAKIPKP